MIIQFFETERLQAQRLVDKDYQLLRQLHTDTETMKTLGGIRSEELTKENLQWNLQQWEEYSVGLWLLYKKENMEFIGSAGLRYIDIQGKLEIDLAYALLSRYWLRGYGTEIGHGCLKIGFGSYNFSSIIAGTQSTNFKSQNVIKKLGFTFESKIFKFGHDQLIYRLKKVDFFD